MTDDLEARAKVYADNKHKPQSQEWYLVHHAYVDACREQARVDAGIAARHFIPGHSVAGPFFADQCAKKILANAGIEEGSET